MRIPKLITVLVVLSLFAVPLFALDVPKKTGRYVNDYANMLSGITEAKLEDALRRFEAQTSNQIVILTFQSLEEESLEDFSIRTAEAWKAGQKDKDNGVMLFIFKEDQKIRIEVGYGLEGALPDATAGQIIQNVIAPQFRAGQYERGVLAGTAAIIQATQGEYKGTGRMYGGYRRQRMTISPEAARGLTVFVLIMVAGLFIADLFRYRGYGNRKDGYSFWEWWFRFGLLLLVLSILFRVLFYSMLFSRGGMGRGGMGGGFSGGGGGFGGGGASGGW